MKNIIGGLNKYGLKQSFWRVSRRLLSNHPVMPSYYMAKYLKGYSIETVNGCKMYLDLKNDEGIARDLFIFKKREHQTTDFVLQTGLIKEGDVVLDIGANIGYYALLWSKLVGDAGLVYALEPVSGNFRSLIKNIKLNNAKNIESYHLAAGSKNEEKLINVYKKGNWSSFASHHDQILKDRELTKVVTVDDFLRNKRMPALVRMDVEGYESEILKGMKQSLQYIPYLLIEVHFQVMDDKQKEEFSSALKDNNFKVKKVFKENPAWLDRKGEVKRFISYINEKIKDGYQKDYNDETDLEEILKQKSGKTPHILFSKE